jgi:hypothetical protein
VKIIFVKLTDGGRSWEIAKQLEYFAFDVLNNIGFSGDKKLGYIFGGNNRILLYNNSVTNVENENTSCSKHYGLLQNYPNPFNPTTTIEYTIPTSESRNQDSELLSLRIYDALGREVATLVNERQSPGKYSIQWDASIYASGLYIYQLSHGTKQITKKMVLVK